MAIRYALLLAYDGTAFHGWWRQPGRRTVAGELDAAFRRVGEPAAAAIGASRTDAGVHAQGQVAHVDLRRDWLPLHLVTALGAHLPADLVCRGVARVDDGWHAVHDVRAKTYRYTVDTGICADPFLAARFAWRPPYARGLDLAALRAAAIPVRGSRDWTAFRRRGEHRADTRCRIIRASWRRQDRSLVCSLTATGFIYRLARSLVGGMVAVAQGGCEFGDWTRALAGEATPAARQQAPAQGLCLHHVRYPAEPAWVTPG